VARSFPQPFLADNRGRRGLIFMPGRRGDWRRFFFCSIVWGYSCQSVRIKARRVANGSRSVAAGHRSPKREQFLHLLRPLHCLRGERSFGLGLKEKKKKKKNKKKKNKHKNNPRSVLRSNSFGRGAFVIRVTPS